MKNFLRATIYLLMITAFTSCSKNENVIPEIDLIPVKVGDNFQYVDKTGKIVINPQFLNATVFREGLALVQSSGEEPKWGYIGEDGKYVISANFIGATVFNDGIAWVVSENSAPKAINTKGEVIFTLSEAQDVYLFSEGLSAFSIIGDDGKKWGFVDKEGKIVINPQFSAVAQFYNDKCAVKNSEGKWGYIGKDGAIAINYQFDRANGFVSDKAVVAVDNKYGVINSEGKYVINPQFSYLSNDNDLFLFIQDGKAGWCDHDGKIVINPQFTAAFNFRGNEYGAVKSSDTFGYIDKEGKYVINPQFEVALPFINDLAIVGSRKKVGFIDKEGKYIVNPQYEDVSGDLTNYLLSGETKFNYVQTDFFDISKITGRIESEITDKTVAGFDFNSSFSTIITKFNKKEEDISKYGSEHEFISAEKLSNSALLTFYVLGNPWLIAGDSWYNTNYVFNKSAVPYGFAYRIQLTGTGYGKEDVVFESLKNVFSSYQKVNEESTDTELVFKNNYQKITIFRYRYNAIVIRINPID
ncbi:MAG: hypothetical protein AMXMBFR48_10380 [Ignavibacteriales bacterium]